MKNLQSSIVGAKKKHQQTYDTFERLVCTIGTADENSKKRNRRKERKHAKALRCIAITLQKRSRRPENAKVIEGKTKKEESPLKLTGAPKKTAKKTDKVSTVLIQVAESRTVADVLEKF